MRVLDHQKRHRRRRENQSVIVGRVMILLGIGAAVWLLGLGIVKLAAYFGQDDESEANPARVLVRVTEETAFTIEVAGKKMIVKNITGGTALSTKDAWRLKLTPEELVTFLDAFGGALVNIPEAVEDRTPEGLPLMIEPGMRRLDAGRIATWLAASDGPSSGKIRAIALGISARTQELLKEGYDLVDLVEAALPKDEKENAAQLAALLIAASEVGPASTVVEWRDAKRLKPGAKEALSPAEPPTAPAAQVIVEPLRIVILNATERAGHAAKAADRFPAPRFSVLDTSNAPRKGVDLTRVISGKLDWAREAAERLGVGIPETGDPQRDADVLIILGADSLGRW